MAGARLPWRLPRDGSPDRRAVGEAGPAGDLAEAVGPRHTAGPADGPLGVVHQEAVAVATPAGLAGAGEQAAAPSRAADAVEILGARHQPGRAGSAVDQRGDRPLYLVG